MVEHAYLCAGCLWWLIDPALGVTAVDAEDGQRKPIRLADATSERFGEHRSTSNIPLRWYADLTIQGTSLCIWHAETPYTRRVR